MPADTEQNPLRTFILEREEHAVFTSPANESGRMGKHENVRSLFFDILLSGEGTAGTAGKKAANCIPLNSEDGGSPVVAARF